MARVICGARCCSRERRGKICQLSAGFGTGHPGMGMCKFHSGSLKNHTAWGKGKTMALPALAYNLATRAITERAQSLSIDPELLTLHREIGLARALIETEISDNLRSELLQSIGKLVERAHRLEIDRKGLIKVQVIVELLKAIGQAVRDSVPNEISRDSILQRFVFLTRYYLRDFYPELLSVPVECIITTEVKLTPGSPEKAKGMS